MGLSIEKPIIVALDGKSWPEAFAIAERLAGAPGVWGVKVNDLLADRIGAYLIIDQLRKLGHKVMADQKIHEIPESAERWTHRYRDAGADLVTVHASGGPEMVSRCVAVSGAMRVIAVTVLTSLNEARGRRIYGAPPAEKVSDLVDLLSEGERVPHGFVCSAQEVAAVREKVAASPWSREERILITPGVRSPGVETHDQMRVGTPAKAILDGATMVVAGRQIMDAADPVVAATAMFEEIQAAAGA